MPPPILPARVRLSLGDLHHNFACYTAYTICTRLYQYDVTRYLSDKRSAWPGHGVTLGDLPAVHYRLTQLSSLEAMYLKAILFGAQTMWSVSQCALRGIAWSSFYRSTPTSAHRITTYRTIRHQQHEFFDTNNSRNITIET